MLNVAEVAPAAMVTDAGTLVEASFELNATTAPPAGAADASVTVQTLGEPPTTEVGLSLSVNVLTAVIVNTAVELDPDSEAEIVALVLAETAVVATVNVTEFIPAGTVTEAGTEATKLFEERAIVTPPAPAADAIVTVPVEVWPPVTVVG